MASSADDLHYQALLENLKDLDAIMQEGYSSTNKMIEGSVNEKLRGIHTRLAPLHGPSYHYKHVKMVDTVLDLVIQPTVNASAACDVDNWSWQDLTDLVRRNPALKPAEATTPSYHSPYTWKPAGLFSQGTPREKVAQEIETWICGLVPDSDIQSAQNIDYGHLGRVVTGEGESAKTVAGTNNTPGRIKSRAERMIIAGILRFPHSTKPYFILYRIQLDVSPARDKPLIRITSQTGGIKGVLYSQKFYLCQEVMDVVKDQVQRQAAADTSALLRGDIRPVGCN